MGSPNLHALMVWSSLELSGNCTSRPVIGCPGGAGAGTCSGIQPTTLGFIWKNPRVGPIPGRWDRLAWDGTQTWVLPIETKEFPSPRTRCARQSLRLIGPDLLAPSLHGYFCGYHDSRLFHKSHVVIDTVERKMP